MSSEEIQQENFWKRTDWEEETATFSQMAGITKRH